MDFLNRALQSLRRRVDTDSCDRLHYKVIVTILLILGLFLCTGLIGAFIASIIPFQRNHISMRGFRVKGAPTPPSYSMFESSTDMFENVLAFVVSTRQYVGQGIQCWVPAQFTAAMEQYTENYCWVQSTYFLPWEEEMIPRPRDRTSLPKVSYYQWVPFILLGQAVLFYLPAALWRLLSSLTGVNLKLIDQIAHECAVAAERNVLEKRVDGLARYMKSNMDLTSKRKRESLDFLRGSLCLTILYFGQKLLYLLVTFSQLVALNRILAANDFIGFHGIEVLVNLIRGIKWENSGFFPRVTLCDFEVRVLGNIHIYTVQCVLMINMYNEWMFILLWFWFLLVAVLSLINFVCWLLVFLLPKRRTKFVRNYLGLQSAVSLHSATHRRLLHLFVHDYLAADGYFLMRMIAKNAGAAVTAQLLAQLWDDFLAEKSAEALDRNGHTTPRENLIHNQYHGQQRPIDGFREEPFIVRIRDESNV